MGLSRIIHSRALLGIALLVFMLGYGRSFIMEHIWDPSSGWALRFSGRENPARAGMAWGLYSPAQGDIIEYLRANLTARHKVLVCENDPVLVLCPVPFLPNPHMHSENLIKLLLRCGDGETAARRLDSWALRILL